MHRNISTVPPADCFHPPPQYTATDRGGNQNGISSHSGFLPQAIPEAHAWELSKKKNRVAAAAAREEGIRAYFFRSDATQWVERRTNR
jgi:hypothetical protein